MSRALKLWTKKFGGLRRGSPKAFLYMLTGEIKLSNLLGVWFHWKSKMTILPFQGVTISRNTPSCSAATRPKRIKHDLYVQAKYTLNVTDRFVDCYGLGLDLQIVYGRSVAWQVAYRPYGLTLIRIDLYVRLPAKCSSSSSFLSSLALDSCI
jgi:hypothetical protein